MTESTTPTPRFRFGIRTLLILTAVIAAVFGLFLREAMQYASRKSRARAMITSHGGSIEKIVDSAAPPSPGSNWLTRRLGVIEPHEVNWSIDLAGSKVTAADLQQLSGCGWILSIDLSKTAIADGDLPVVAKLTKLGRIGLNDTSVSDDGLEHLKSLRNLSRLDVNGTKVTYDGLRKFEKRFPDQRFFSDAWAVSQLRDEVSIRLIQRFAFIQPSSLNYVYRVGQLDGLRFNDEAELTPETIALFRKLTKLRSFYGIFPRTENFAHWDLVADMPELRDIFINGGGFSDDDIRHLSHHQQLKYLSFVGSLDVTAEGLEQLVDLPRLERLNIKGLKTNTSFVEHLGTFNNLKALSLSDYRNPTPERNAEITAAFKKLRSYPRLESLRLHGRAFSDEVLLSIPESLPRLKQLVITKDTDPKTVAKLRKLIPDVSTSGVSDSIDLE